MSKQELGWRVHTTGLLKEIQSNFQTPMIIVPIKILDSLLREVAQRAIELNDKKLNALMVRLTLYSIADPDSPDYDNKAVSKILGE